MLVTENHKDLLNMNKILKMIVMIPFISLGEVYTRTETFDEPTLIGDRLFIPDTISEENVGKPLIPFREVIFNLTEKEEVVNVHCVFTNMFVKSGTPRVCQPPVNNFTPEQPYTENYNTNIAYPTTQYDSYVESRGKDKYLVIKLYPMYYTANKKLVEFYETVNITVETREILARLLAAPDTHILDYADHKYVILTTNTFLNSTNEYNINKLLTYRYSRGYTTNVVTVNWIYSNYVGVDPQAKIRKFCQEAYTYWGTEYLLIIGRYNSVPIRYIKTNSSSSGDSIPSDSSYYGCIEGTYDSNNNGVYGQLLDGPGGTFVDLTAEIKVGRFPVINNNELSNMIRKTIKRESCPDNSKFSFVGEWLARNPMFGGMVYGSTINANLVSIYTHPLLVNLGYPEISSLNDYDGYSFTEQESRNFLNNNYSMIHHNGHGSVVSGFKILSLNVNTFNYLTNDIPYCIFSVACDVAELDHPTYRSFAEALLVGEHGAYATIMNTKYGWFSTMGDVAYSPLLQRYFSVSSVGGTKFIGNGKWAPLELRYTLGDTYEEMKRLILPSVKQISESIYYYCFLTPALYGDPATVVFPYSYTNQPAIQSFNINLVSNKFNITTELLPVPLVNSTNIVITFNSMNRDYQVPLRRTDKNGEYSCSISKLLLQSSTNQSMYVGSMSGQSITTNNFISKKDIKKESESPLYIRWIYDYLNN